MDEMQIHAKQFESLTSTISDFYNSNLYTDRSYFKATVTAKITESIYRVMVEPVVETILSDIDNRTGQHSIYWMNVLASKLFILHEFCVNHNIAIVFFYKDKEFLSLGRDVTLPYDESYIKNGID